MSDINVGGDGMEMSDDEGLGGVVSLAAGLNGVSDGGAHARGLVLSVPAFASI